MHACTNFESIWRTSVFVTKFAQKDINKNLFEKINMKIIISI